MSFRILLVVVLLSMSATSHGLKELKQAIREAFYSVMTQSFDSSVKQAPLTDRGVVKSCGPPDANFSLEWEPRVLNPDGDIVVYYDYKIPHYFKNGKMYVALYFNTITNPIFEDTFPIGCNKIGKYIPCPLIAGVRLQGKYPYSSLLVLKGYDGTYRGEIKLTNSKNQVMFCANATVEVRQSKIISQN